MDQLRSGSTEPNRTAKLMVFWEDHKLAVILVSCFALPIIFVPVWILVFLVPRARNALGLSRRLPPSEGLSDVADASEKGFADRKSKMEAVEQLEFPVGLFFKGFVAVVGVMLCVLGWKVIGLTSGQPGGGIALLMGYSLFAGGAIATIIGVISLAKRVG